MGAWPLGLGRQNHIHGLDENIFDWQRLAIGLQAFQVDKDSFADVGDRFFERITFGMAAGKGGTRSVVSAISLSLKKLRYIAS